MVDTLKVQLVRVVVVVVMCGVVMVGGETSIGFGGEAGSFPLKSVE